MLTSVFKTYPTVYAVGNMYQIFVPVTCETVMWAQVGDKNYYDHSNGTLRSGTMLHKMTVPMEALDSCKKYKICYRIVNERLAYFSKCEEEVAVEFDFKPLTKTENINIYHVSDAHNKVEPVVNCGTYFGDDLDLLILNGDVPNDCSTVENLDTIYLISGQITKGEIPAVFARGNHDLRGVCAEKMAEYSPTNNGISYYTFRVGCVWGLVLDCGEDKPDGNPEYGHTICCHSFREEETQFIKDVIKNAENEYGAQGVKYKMVICHVPFTQVTKPPFDIEQDIYKEWAKLIGENIKPQVMMSGHTHFLDVYRVGGEYDHLGQFCDIVVAANPFYTSTMRIEEKFEGGGLVLNNDCIDVVFTNQDKEVVRTEKIKI